MNWIDITIIVVLVWLAISAFSAGLVREVVTTTTLVLAIAVAGIYYDEAATDVLVFINDESAANLAGFLVILGAILIAGQLAAALLKSGVSLLMLGWADHIAGACFGLLKGFLLVQALLIISVTFGPTAVEGALAGSRFAPLFLDATPILLKLLPGQFEDAVEGFQVMDIALRRLRPV